MARAPLALAAGSSALLFGWAAWELPSQPWTLLGLLAGSLSAAHALTLGILWFSPGRLHLAWRALSWLSLGAGGLFAGAVGWTCAVMLARFGSLGQGVTALLAAVGVLLLLATLPFAAWGLRATRGAHAAR